MIDPSERSLAIIVEHYDDRNGFLNDLSYVDPNLLVDQTENPFLRRSSAASSSQADETCNRTPRWLELVGSAWLA